MDRKKQLFLKEKSNFIRNEVISVSVRNRAGHLAPSLSSIDILVALYYYAMNYNPDNPLWEERDRLIFSKAHGCYALYAILADIGVIQKDEWRNFYTQTCSLMGCIERNPEYGLEASCGSLGHGLPLATGLAFGAKLQGKSYDIFCVVGDGELQEGSTWEALQFAVKHKLGNLFIIVDANHLQAMDFITNVLDMSKEDKIRKLRGFGVSPLVFPGHNVVRLAEGISSLKAGVGNIPKVIVARTIKGFGLKCMENVPKFHFRLPTDEELALGRTYE